MATPPDRPDIRYSGDMTIKFKKVRPSAVVPTQGRHGDAAYDLSYCPESQESHVTLAPTPQLIPTGIAVAIPFGYCGFILPRSGLSLEGATVPNSPGLIDSNYRGEIKVIMGTVGQLALPRETLRWSKIDINPGDRIAQLLIIKHQHVSFVEVDDLNDTERGSQGFGSSGA